MKKISIIAATCGFLLLLCGLIWLLCATHNSLITQDNAHQDFLLKCAKYVYRVEPYFMLCLSVALSIIFWVVPRPDKLKSPVTYLILSIVAVLLVLAGYIQLVKENYTYVPDINLYNESLQSVESKFQAAGLQISDDNIIFNDLAKSRKDAGKDAYGFDFKVCKTAPQPNSFVQKRTDVMLEVTWRGTPAAISVPDKNNGDAELTDVYINTNTRFIYPYNADMFTLYTNAAGAKITAEGFDEMTLGISPTYSIPIEARLINYDTRKQIDSKTAMLGDEITFSNIPNGTYYYVVSSDGYKTAIPDSPFKLERDYTREADVLPWGVDLEKEGSQLSSVFKVCLQNDSGKIIQNSEVDVRVISGDGPSPNAFTHRPFYSDENGYLTSWYSIDNKDIYAPTDFQLYEDCYLEARLNEYDEFIRVQIKDGIGVCTIPE